MACAWGKLNNVIAENLIDISYGIRQPRKYLAAILFSVYDEMH